MAYTFSIRPESAEGPASPPTRLCPGVHSQSFAVAPVTRLLACLFLVLVQGCASVKTVVRIRDSEAPILRHAVFLQQSGEPALLVDEDWKTFDIDRALPSPHRTISAANRTGDSTASPPAGAGWGEYDFDRYLDGILESILESGKDTLLIYIHGGRNTLGGALKNSLRDLRALESTRYYPIFINWESGDGDAYWDHLLHFDGEGIVQGLYDVALDPFLTVVSDIGHGVTETPRLFVVDLNRSAGTLIRSRNPQVARGRDSLNIWVPAYENQGRARPWWGGRWLDPFAVVDFYGSLSRVGPAAVVAILGTGEWETMRRTGRALVHGGVHGSSRKFEIGYKAPRGAVARLLYRLEALCRQRPNLQVMIISHSTGAIVVTEMLTSAHDLRVSDIVMFGAACTIRDFRSSVVPYMIEHRETRCYIVCLDPLNEVRETLPKLGPFGPLVYRGSLLTWIDDYLAPEGDFYDRTLGRIDNILATQQIIPDSIRSRVYVRALSRDSEDPVLGGARRHSELVKPKTGTKYWDRAYWWPERAMGIGDGQP